MAKRNATGDQTQRFIEAARELGCDESEERFDDALRKVAKAKPKPEAEKPKPKKPGQ
jgi:hypothetical protein